MSKKSGNFPTTPGDKPLAMEQPIKPASPDQERGLEYTEEITELRWQGPLPPPEFLRHYNDIVAGGANRILSQFESETAHRHQRERNEQNFAFFERLFARFSALIFAFGCLGLAGFAIVHNAQWAAVTFGGAMIVAGINAFLKQVQSGETSKSKEIKSSQKRKP